MHAHINIWRMSDAGDSGSDRIASQIAETLRQQPGFHSYSFVRTGDGEFIAVTMFETNAQLHAALEQIDEQVLRNLHQIAAGAPEQHAGDVLVHVMVEQ
jgi:heme-degrading monooxygenase HmoA